MSSKFVQYGGKRFPLDEGMTLEQAKDVMARHFPELADPKVETKKDGEITVYVFTKRAGRKGIDLAGIIVKLDRLENEPIDDALVSLARSTSETPETNLSADHIRGVASELGHDARTVHQIGDALLSLPTSAQPTGSIL